MAQLLVPRGWPLVWWSQTDVRMPCPACGTFFLFRRGNGILACDECGISGLKDVQAAFTKHLQAQASADAARARDAAQAEAAREVQRKKEPTK